MANRRRTVVQAPDRRPCSREQLEVFCSLVMTHDTVQYLIRILWVAQLTLKSALAVTLLVRKAWKTFPAFTAYALFSLLSGIWSFFVYGSYGSSRLYAYSYVVVEAVSVLLGIAVLYEIFLQLFSSQPALRNLARYLLCLTVILLFTFGMVVIYTHAPGLKYVKVAISVSEEAARTLEVGLLLFLFICSGTFGLHWRQPVFGIAVGMGLYTTVQLVMMMVWGRELSTGGGIIAIAGPLAFTLSLITWIGYLARPEQAAVHDLPERSQLEQWNRAVMELIHQ